MRKTTNHRMALLTALGLCGSLAAANALAGLADTEGPRVHVQYGDLDLTRHADVETLYARITAAANRVCGRASPIELRKLQITKACRERAIADAVEQVNQPVLTALHQSRASQLG